MVMVLVGGYGSEERLASREAGLQMSTICDWCKTGPVERW
jgi:hypothetical protein